MSKIITTLTIAGAMSLATASGASANGPTCSDLGYANHAEHVLTDYVRNGGAAGGKPAHLDGVAAPGASFCLDQAKSPGYHFP